MSRFARTIVAICALFGVPHSSSAGEITSCLSAGDQGCDRRVLEHVPFKAVVLEVIDPRNSGIGESVSRLIWRETLYSIRDMAGRGVILGKDFEGAVRERYDESPESMLDRRFHEAADEISAFLETQMALWGAVVGEGEASTLYTFLSVPTDRWNERLGLSLVDGETGPTGIVAGLSNTRFNFAPLYFETRRDLFGDRLRVRCALSSGCPDGIPAYAEPADGLPASHRLAEKMVVEIIDMNGKWMEIVAPDGATAYLNIYHTEIAPRFARARNRDNVNIRSAPGATGADTVIGRADLDGRYVILEMALVGANQLPWYRIRSPVGEGWVAGWLVEPLYRFPVVHFVAGLYRYSARQFDHAEREFRNYLEAVSEDGDRVSRSAAWQLIAMSRARQVESFAADELVSKPVLAALEEARSLTPFDPAIFRTRGLLRLMGREPPALALEDFTQAVELAPRSTETKALLDAVLYVSRERPGVLYQWGLDIDRLDLNALRELSDNITPIIQR